MTFTIVLLFHLMVYHQVLVHFVDVKITLINDKNLYLFFISTCVYDLAKKIQN